MRVTGPDWPSTASLRLALRDVESDKVVRWGVGGADGLQQLIAFREAGIRCPEFTTSLDEAREWVRAGHRVFGRRLHHTQGSDIIGPGYRAALRGIPRREVLRWITTRKGNHVQRLRWVQGVPSRPEAFNRHWEERDFWVKVLPSIAEYRQHVWDGKCIRVGKKVESGNHPRVQPVRSRLNGWHIDYGFQCPSEEFKTSIRTLAKQACEAVGYVGGAVDILEVQPGQFAALEVNSAPSLRDENTLQAYVEAIKKWAVRRER
jgi:hypothetical protein